MCKPVICKLKILGGGNLNIINLWGNHKKRGNQIFEVQWGEAKGGGNTTFDLKLVGEKPWRKLWVRNNSFLERFVYELNE